MRTIVLCLLIILSLKSTAQSVPDKDRQVFQALLAAPMDKRANATVLGYDDLSQVVTLREGSNEFICLAKDPAATKFSVACYHKDLDPFMARGRELKSQGLDFKSIFDIREKEVKAGDLKIPENSTLMVLAGDEDPETGMVKNPHLRYVVYIPFATSESTGLPEAPIGPGAPWIMNPGTHRAHIMITPPKK